jgi:hypothetical protein
LVVEPAREVQRLIARGRLFGQSRVLRSQSQLVRDAIDHVAGADAVRARKFVEDDGMRDQPLLLDFQQL